MTVLAALAWLVVLLIPGLAVWCLLGVAPTRGSSIASAPLLTVGVTYTVGLAATRLGLPAVGTTVIATAVVVVLGVLRWIRGRRVASELTPWRARAAVAASSTHAGALVLLSIACVLGFLFWELLHAPMLTPPGYDAMHHGFFVRQIVDHSTLASPRVLASSAYTSDGVGFYPLSINLLTAVLVKLTGLPISTLLLASSTAIAGVLLPLGTFQLALTLLPGRPLVGGFAAVAAVLPANLYGIDLTGRITATIGIALVPAGVVAIAWTRGRSDPPLLPAGVVVALVVVGMAGVHTSEVVMVLGAAVLVAALDASHGSWLRAARWLAVTVGATLVGIVLLILLSPGITHLTGERAGSMGQPGGYELTLLDTLRLVLLMPNLYLGDGWPAMAFWSATAAAGCLLVVRNRYRAARGIALAYAGFGAFLALWYSGTLPRPLWPLGSPWYGDPVRMFWAMLPLGGVLIGVVVDAILGALTAVLRQQLPASQGNRPAGSLNRAVVPAFFCVVLVVAAPPIDVERRVIQQAAAPVDGHYQRAFSWLDRHNPAGASVVDDLNLHGDTWMYVDQRVPTLFGNAPLLGLADDSWKRRLYLREHLTDVGRDGCVAPLLTRFKVRYVFWGSRTMSGGREAITLAGLEHNHLITQVFRSGDARVFRLDQPKRRRPCLVDVDTAYPWSTLANAN